MARMRPELSPGAYSPTAAAPKGAWQRSILAGILPGDDGRAFAGYNAARAAAACDGDFVERWRPPLCLGRLWGVNWPGEGTVFDRLTVVKGEYTDVVIERALRVCKRRP